jgi:hypothetical protein
MNIRMILQELYPTAEWVLAGDAYEGLDWLSDSPKPTEAELVSAWPEVENLRKIRIVESARQEAYRETADPVFFRFQAGEATEQEWLDARQAVRDAHPYPEA